MKRADDAKVLLEAAPGLGRPWKRWRSPLLDAQKEMRSGTATLLLREPATPCGTSRGSDRCSLPAVRMRLLLHKGAASTLQQQTCKAGIGRNADGKMPCGLARWADWQKTARGGERGTKAEQSETDVQTRRQPGKTPNRCSRKKIACPGSDPAQTPMRPSRRRGTCDG